jgi:TPP-dependent trihydroxycyclohexane-1,2-dione (THcHDO) dehydratase
VLPTVKIQPLFVLGGPVKLVGAKSLTEFLEEFIIDNTDTTEGINVVTVDQQAACGSVGSDTQFG